MTSDAVPRRLSDAEREAAVSALRLHADAGRLSGDEFAERSDGARAARTASDMAPLFRDLPNPHPAYLDDDRPTWTTYPGPGARGTAPEPGAPGYAGYPPAGYGPSTAPLEGTLVPREPPPAPDAQRDRWLGAIHGLIWPIAILLMITGHGFWWIFVAIAVSSVLGGYQGQRRRRQPPPY